MNATYPLLLLWMLATIRWWPRPALPPLRQMAYVGATEHWSPSADYAGRRDVDPDVVAALDAIEDRLHEGLRFVEVFVAAWLLDEENTDPWVAVHLALDGIEVS
jgi:hypothetical protein